MNSKLYKQADSRWGKKPYPSGSTMSGCGCGCVACTHVIIEQSKYKDYTPEPIRQYMVSQGFAIRGQGTTWNGITKTLTHYGYKVVHIGINDPMSKAWAELNKGNRIGVILFKGGKAPNGTVWTAGGHYVAFVDYKVKNGLHYFYTKDSGARDHDSATHGYYSYEKSMKGLVYQMWIVERIPEPAKVVTTTISVPKTTSSKLTVDGKGGKSTVKAMQKYFGTTVDGVITGQKKSNKKHYSALTSVTFGKNGSTCIKKLQKWVGASADGVLGEGTAKKWQKKLASLGYYKGTIDGKFGPSSMKAWQKFLNDNWGKKAVMPTTTTTKKSTTSTTKTSVVKVSSNKDKLIAKARELSWPKGTKASKFAWKGGSATSAFKTALSKAYPKRSGWSAAPRKGCSCDVAIGTLVRASGVDKKFPRGRSEQRKYKSAKFTRIVKTNARPIDYLQPGDIGLYDRTSGGKKGHIFFYTTEGIYEAANKSKYFHLNTSLAKLKKKYKKIIILRAK